jgi:sugar phosphate permease
MVGSQLASRVLYPRFGPRRLIAVGLSCVAVVMVAMTSIHDRDQLWAMRALMFALGFSMSMNFMATQASSFARISPADTGRASTTFNALRQLGGAAGVAVLTSVVVGYGVTADPDSRPSLHPYHVAFLVAAAIALLAALVSLAIHDSDADSTRPGRPVAPPLHDLRATTAP